MLQLHRAWAVMFMGSIRNPGESGDELVTFNVQLHAPKKLFTVIVNVLDPLRVLHTAGFDREVAYTALGQPFIVGNHPVTRSLRLKIHERGSVGGLDYPVLGLHGPNLTRFHQSFKLLRH